MTFLLLSDALLLLLLNLLLNLALLLRPLSLLISLSLLLLSGKLTLNTLLELFLNLLLTGMSPSPLLLFLGPPLLLPRNQLLPRALWRYSRRRSPHTLLNLWQHPLGTPDILARTRNPGN